LGGLKLEMETILPKKRSGEKLLLTKPTHRKIPKGKKPKKVQFVSFACGSLKVVSKEEGRSGGSEGGGRGSLACGMYRDKFRDLKRAWEKKQIYQREKSIHLAGSSKPRGKNWSRGFPTKGHSKERGRGPGKEVGE